MANQEHLDILTQGVETWNQWRKEHPEIQPDFCEIDLSGTDLKGANLSRAQLFRAKLERANLNGASLTQADLNGTHLSGIHLSRAGLGGANFYKADLSGARLDRATLNGATLYAANINKANLNGAYLFGTYLCEANLRGADLGSADLRLANLSRADLSGVNLKEATLVGTNFSEAILTDCCIYGIAAWSVILRGTKQNNLVITREWEPTITVDNLKMAQFIHLLLDNAEIRDVIDTITSKVVLLLGRFTPERKMVLNALREELRKYNYSPVVFDFDKPASRDLTGTISTLAHLARFIIVDLTDPSSAPHEVATVIPHTVVPVQPLLSREPLMVDGRVVERREYSMFQDLRRRHDWVLPTHSYTDQAHLLATLKEAVIEPAEQKARELEMR